MPSATAINVIFHQNVSSAGKIMWGKGIGKRTTPPNFSWSTPGEENIICYSLGPCSNEENTGLWLVISLVFSNARRVITVCMIHGLGFFIR